ncbi:OmpA family protein [Spirosoma sp. BT702]|uniref:OmpA family protein n=1 Tax=Spirosoma profusum TaxID=2771354 RepID=A0A926XTG9_9BACT|nr:PA14 domain-containing protein [Spirosoma profusum]MBD2699205.1 OmpA family protein [Spirosoma profusum]
MYQLTTISIVLFWLLTGQTLAQSGLRGDYYTGVNFEQKVLSRIDPQISFDWAYTSPDPRIPRSEYSVRWTGKLLAPVSGEYRFYAHVNDGIRVWIGNKLVIESWRLNSNKNYTGSITLEEGRYYDLRVDYFNDIEWGNIRLYWQRPDTKRSFWDRFSNPDELITAKYFSQKTPAPPLPPKPAPPKSTTTVSIPPKTIPSKRLALNLKKPVITPVTNRTLIPVDTLPSAPKPAPKPPTEAPSALQPGQIVVLRNVQFEQSSYVLLPESADELNKVVRVMTANPQWHIHVAGHTDNVGDPRLNVALSENRARVVANYFTRYGINAERITTEGFGGKQPVTDNSTEGERSKNRRVEITIK